MQLPDSRGHRVAADVCRNPLADRPAAGAACTGMRGVGVRCGKRWGRGMPWPRKSSAVQAILVPPTASFDRLLLALGAICFAQADKVGDAGLKTARNLANGSSDRS